MLGMYALMVLFRLSGKHKNKPTSRTRFCAVTIVKHMDMQLQNHNSHVQKPKSPPITYPTEHDPTTFQYQIICNMQVQA